MRLSFLSILSLLIVETLPQNRVEISSAASCMVARATEISTAIRKPVVIADTQDNPGAGGSSDTTGNLRALLKSNARNVALGLMSDSAAALAAHAAGVGGTIRLSLGGKSGVAGDAPFVGDFLVERIVDGRVEGTGPFLRGFKLNLGPTACLRIGGVRIVVASTKTQMADLEMFRMVGIEPEAVAILVVKSSAHFRAAFTPIAADILMCVSPGSMIANPADLPWQRLQPGIRVSPLGSPFLAHRAISRVC